MPATPKSTLSRDGVAGALSALFNEVIHRTDFLRAKSVECDLDNDIHPIFRASQWADLDPVDYAKIKPSLQLATLWVTDDRMLDWIYHDTAGIVKTAVRDGQTKHYLELPPGINIQDPAGRLHCRKLWYDKLLSVATSGKLYFHHHSYTRDVGGAWGITFYHPFLMSEHLTHLLDGNSGKYAHLFAMNVDGKVVPLRLSEPQIMLSQVFKTFMASVPLDTSHLNKELKLEILAFQFFFATTLVHELMHVMTNTPHFRDWDLHRGVAKEVFHSRHEMDAYWIRRMNRGSPESGSSWQIHTFGAPIMPKLSLLPFHQAYEDLDDPSCFVLGKSFLIFQEKYLWRHRELLERNGIRVPTDNGGLMVPGEDIAKWFRKEHWAPERTYADLIRDKAETYLFDVHLHIGYWAVPNSWDLHTPVTVTFKVYNTEDIV